MLQCKRIDVSEGIDTNEVSASKECILCQYQYFKNIGCKFESNACNECHDVLMNAYELKKIAILNVRGVDYKCILWGISGNKAVNILNKSILEDKDVLQMEFISSETPIEIIKEKHLKELNSDAFVQVLMKNGIKIHGKNLVS